MDERNQIEEMANCLCREYGTDRCNPDCGAHGHCNIYFDCKVLYEAGYRKQVEGEWKLGGSGLIYFCSECNYAAHPREVDEWGFCPHCGAKMKGENR